MGTRGREEEAWARPVSCHELCCGQEILGGRFEYFLFFLCSGRGKRESEPPVGGEDRFIESPRRGGSPGRQEGVCGELGDFWGGGGKYFFFGAEMSTKNLVHMSSESGSSGITVTELYILVVQTSEK